MKKYWKIGLLCLSVIVVAGLGVSLVMSARNKEINTLDVKLAEINNKIATITNTGEKKVLTAIENQSGLSKERVDKDTLVLVAFFDKVLTWDSYDKYMAIREDVKKEYGFDENSSFLGVFMPPITNKVHEGRNYNKIDIAKLNMTYKNLKLYPVGVGSTYRYVVEVDVITRSENSGETTSNVVVLVDVDVNGKLTNLTAYPVIQ